MSNANSKPVCCKCGSTPSQELNPDKKIVKLVGNPNCGKSTLFNRITGSSVRTGNYPGVTVTRHVGDYSASVQIVDLPGIYSLTSATAEEGVASAELLSGDCDLAINIIDATSLERSLYLTLELRQLGVPMIVLLNMWDAAQKEKIFIDPKKLSDELGCPVIPVSAVRGEGISDIRAFIDSADWRGSDPKYIGSDRMAGIFKKLAAKIEDRFDSRSLFLAKSAVMRDSLPEELEADFSFAAEADAARREASDGFGNEHEALASDRYKAIAGILESCFKRETDRSENLSSRLDKIFLNKFLAFPLFIAIMFGVYYVSVTWLGGIATDWTNDTLFGEMLVPWSTELMKSMNAPGWLCSFVGDGVIGGVGSVLGFVPQMVILFLLLSVLEECGYMTRAAFILDRVFNLFGMSGRAFIPYLISSGCGVPGLMTARNLGSESERKSVLFTATLIPCGAKLPVIVIFASAVFSDYPFFAPCVYLAAVALAILSVAILSKLTAFRRSPSTMMLELPLYHIPSWRVVLSTAYRRSKAFVIKAGTIIFASVAVIWMLSTFGYSSEDGFRQVDSTDDSLMAAVAKPASVVFRPLGFDDYRATVAVISGIVAKENIVSTMSMFLGFEEEEETEAAENSGASEVLASANADAAAAAEIAATAEDAEEEDAESEFLNKNLFGEFFGSNYLVAIAFVLFNLFTIPCFASLGVIKQEIGSWKFFGAALAYQIGLSYGLAFCVYQLGSWFTGNGFGVGPALALAIIIGIAGWLTFKKRPSEDERIAFKLCDLTQE